MIANQTSLIQLAKEKMYCRITALRSREEIGFTLSSGSYFYVAHMNYNYRIALVLFESFHRTRFPSDTQRTLYIVWHEQNQKDYGLLSHKVFEYAV